MGYVVATRSAVMSFLALLGGLVYVAMVHVGWPTNLSTLVAGGLAVTFGIKAWRHISVLYREANPSLPYTAAQAAQYSARASGVAGLSLVAFAVAYASVEYVFGENGAARQYLASPSPRTPQVDEEASRLRERLRREKPERSISSRIPPEHPGPLGIAQYVVGIACGVVIWKFARRFLIPPDEEEDKPRGRQLASFHKAQREAKKSLHRGDRGFLWGGFRWPWNEATRHMLFLGATGSGKSNSMLITLGDVLPLIGLGKGHRALVYDGKQELLSAICAMNLNCKVFVLNPLDLRSVAWDIAADCQSPAVVDHLSTVLIPEDKNEHAYFSRSCQVLAGGTINGLNASCPGKWELRDFLLAMRNPAAIRELCQKTPASADLEVFFRKESTFLDTFTTGYTKLNSLSVIAAAWSRCTEKISLKHWVDDEAILVLGSSPHVEHPLQEIYKTMIRVASDLLLSYGRSDTRRTWIVLDEVQNAAPLHLSPLLNQGRDRGVCVMLGLQDIDGFMAKYGEDTGRSLLSQCGYKTILRLESESSARWASRTIGECEQQQRSKGTTKATGKERRDTTETINTHLVKRDTVLPSEIMDLTPASPENGLTGYYLSRYAGVYKATLAGKWVSKHLKGQNPSIPNMLPRPPADEELRPWTEEDCKRLNLSTAVLNQAACQGVSANEPPKKDPPKAQIGITRKGKKGT